MWHSSMDLSHAPGTRCDRRNASHRALPSEAAGTQQGDDQPQAEDRRDDKAEHAKQRIAQEQGRHLRLHDEGRANDTRRQNDGQRQAIAGRRTVFVNHAVKRGADRYNVQPGSVTFLQRFGGALNAN
jgi:hypothetical protein